VTTTTLVGVTAAAAALLHLTHTRSALFFLVVLASSWRAGFGPGLFASVLSVLVLNYFSFDTRLGFGAGSEDFVELMVFSLVAAFTSNLVAQRRKTSNELASFNSELEHRVQNRTTELENANQQLQDEIEMRGRMQQELARSNNELEHFAHVISHDIRAPLRAITVSAADLKRHQNQSDAEAAELLNHIQLTAEHIEAFISGILSFARVNAHRAIAAEDVSMEATLHWALLNLKPAIEQSQASITYDRLPNVRGDQAQIAALLQNLISNAIQYRSTEPLRVHVSTRQTSGGCVFAITDNGIGIPPEFRESVFEMFTRLHYGREYPGSGLGLAICRKIVGHHGGRIWVESKPGSGSTFFFTLQQSDDRAVGCRMEVPSTYQPLSVGGFQIHRATVPMNVPSELGVL